jgi:hypothetical protein
LTGKTHAPKAATSASPISQQRPTGILHAVQNAHPTGTLDEPTRLENSFARGKSPTSAWRISQQPLTSAAPPRKVDET